MDKDPMHVSVNTATDLSTLETKLESMFENFLVRVKQLCCNIDKV